MPRWLSITGKQLGDDLDSDIQGIHQENPALDHANSSGQCTSIKAFDKLNQLGEGSKSATDWVSKHASIC